MEEVELEKKKIEKKLGQDSSSNSLWKERVGTLMD